MADPQNIGRMLAIQTLLNMGEEKQGRLNELYGIYPKGRSPGISYLKKDIGMLNRNLAGPFVNWNLPWDDDPYSKVFTDIGTKNPRQLRTGIDTAQKATMNARKAAGLTGHHGTALKTMLPMLKKLFQQKKYGLITGLLTRLSERGYQFEDAQKALAYIDPGAHMPFTKQVIGALGELGITDVPTELKEVLEPWTANATHVGGTNLKIGQTSLKIPENLADLVDTPDQLADLVEYYLQVQQVGLANAQQADRFIGQVNKTGDVTQEVVKLTKKLGNQEPAKVNKLTEIIQQINNAAASPTGKAWLRRAAIAGGTLSILSPPLDLVAAPASQEHAEARRAEADANPNDWWLQRQAELDRAVAGFDAASAAMAEDGATPGKAQAELGSLGGTILSSAMDFGRWMQSWIPKPTYPLNPRQPYEDQLNSTKTFR